jgi:hypothetical protein
LFIFLKKRSNKQKPKTKEIEVIIYLSMPNLKRIFGINTIEEKIKKRTTKRIDSKKLPGKCFIIINLDILKLSKKDLIF